jgi:hypothetical protein
VSAWSDGPDPAVAPLTVAFTAFPGIDVRMGRTSNFYRPNVPAVTAPPVSRSFSTDSSQASHPQFGERLVRERGWPQ